MNKVICVLSLGLRLLLFILANDRLKCCICQRHASSLVIHAIEESLNRQWNTRNILNQHLAWDQMTKRDGMICLGCVRAVYKWRKSGKPMNQVGTPFLHAVSSISMQSLFMTHLRHLQSHECVVWLKRGEGCLDLPLWVSRHCEATSFPLLASSMALLSSYLNQFSLQLGQ